MFPTISSYGESSTKVCKDGTSPQALEVVFGKCPGIQEDSNKSQAMEVDPYKSSIREFLLYKSMCTLRKVIPIKLAIMEPSCDNSAAIESAVKVFKGKLAVMEVDFDNSAVKEVAS